MRVSVIPVGVIGANCYVLASEAGSCAIIDPGAQPDKINEFLEEEELTPRFILLTHGHYDHIGGVKKLVDLHPELKVYIGAGDQEQLTDTEKSLAVLRGVEAKNYLIEGSEPLEEDRELALDELTIKVLDTPGHTRGGVCYLCGDVIFSGDTLFQDNIGRCDLYGGDYSVMKQSLKKLAALPGDYTVYPGHGDSTTLDYERQNNRYVNE